MVDFEIVRTYLPSYAVAWFHAYYHGLAAVFLCSLAILSWLVCRHHRHSGLCWRRHSPTENLDDLTSPFITPRHDFREAVAGTPPPFQKRASWPPTPSTKSPGTSPKSMLTPPRADAAEVKTFDSTAGAGHDCACAVQLVF